MEDNKIIKQEIMTSKNEDNLLLNMDKIVNMVKEKGMCAEFFEEASPYIERVKTAFEINEKQAMFLSIFVSEYGKRTDTAFADLERILKCSSCRLIFELGNISMLQKRRYISLAGRNSYRVTGNSYRVPEGVIAALRENKAYQAPSFKNLTTEDFFDKIDELVAKNRNEYRNEWSDDENDYNLLCQDINDLLADNRQLPVTKYLEPLNLCDADKIILLTLCVDCIFFGKSTGSYLRDFRGLLSYNEFTSKRRQFRNKRGDLFESKLIECVNDEGFEDREMFKLTDKAQNELLGELNLQTKSKKGMIEWASLPEKKLFYNPQEQGKVEELTSLLMNENFQNIQKRLKDKGMRTGFACLFYGDPGTGKTETVYQMARKTGRDILLVDISQTKSMWFGESEKRIKEVFDRYRAKVKEAAIAPILLFNEADAVISKRQNLGNERKGCGQTENTIQNIILQEMEKLDGILIATTNLLQNLDKAFERRFLYKIEFHNPNSYAKSAIWQSILPSISQENALSLAQQFDFSGGQIENIARKCTVNSILFGKETDFEQLISYCHDESLVKKQNSIGFHTGD
ncbi:MAG: ATP-binding protein [Bacteroidales bacterium]|jgi:hypothetical protein|nr:ATP-binding protein [Bacteroidales bacterium]